MGLIEGIDRILSWLRFGGLLSDRQLILPIAPDGAGHLPFGRVFVASLSFEHHRTFRICTECFELLVWIRLSMFGDWRYGR